MFGFTKYDIIFGILIKLSLHTAYIFVRNSRTFISKPHELIMVSFAGLMF